MAQTIAIPVCTVSPAGGGTCTYTLGTSGSISGATGAYQNYVFTATPAPGWRFLRFNVTGEIIDSVTGSRNISRQPTDNPYTTQEDGDTFEEDGSAWWWSLYGVNEWVDSISVEAVFEPRNSGRLIYSANQGSALVRSANQGGALVYDGDFVV